MYAESHALGMWQLANHITPDVSDRATRFANILALYSYTYASPYVLVRVTASYGGWL